MLHFTSNLQKSLVGTAFLKAATAKMVALLSIIHVAFLAAYHIVGQ